MARIIVSSVVAPAHWASALVNGDLSGLDDEESAACRAWVEWLQPAYVVDTARDKDGEGHEPEFRNWRGLMTDCLTYVTHQQPKYRYETILQSNYGRGWEDTTACERGYTAKQALSDYRSNQPEYPHRVIKRRTPTSRIGDKKGT